MNLLLASLAWLIIGLILAIGIFLLVAKGSPWLFILWTVGFIGVVGYFCYTS